MKTRRIATGLGSFLCLLMLVAIATALHPALATAHAMTPLLGTHPLSMLAPIAGMITIPWRPAMTESELKGIVNPQSAGEPEVIPWQLYDTQDATTAVAAPLVFYTAQNNDKTLCNMEGAGALPDPQYFEVQYIACDILQLTVATALASEPNAAIANLDNIHRTNRATVEFSMSNKLYGPFSLSMCHATGGITGNGYGYGTAANGTSAFAVNNGVPGGGGFPFCGALVIPPKINFSATIRFAGALTLVGGPIKIRLSLVGSLYRRVL